LDAKQDTIPANDSNSVLTYTGVAGSIGSKGVYQDSGTYAEQMDDLVTAETFNSALANGLNNEFICAEYDPAEPDKCWLWEIRALNPNAKTNYFIMDLIPEGTDVYGSTITRNANGSITISIGPSNRYYIWHKTLSQLAPGLEIGKQYKLTIDTTGIQKIYISALSEWWENNEIKTITEEMPSSVVRLYANGLDTTATISSIRIEAVDDDVQRGTYVSAVGTVTVGSTPTPTNPVYPVFYQQGEMTLRKIDDTYYDSFDAATHKITRRVGVKVLNGADVWSLHTNPAYISAYPTFFSQTAITNSKRIDASAPSPMYCSHFVAAPVSAANGTPMVDNTVSLNSTRHSLNALWIRTSLYSTNAAFTSFLATQYAAGTPVTIYYPLATPVEEDWPDTTYSIYLPQGQ